MKRMRFSICITVLALLLTSCIQPQETDASSTVRAATAQTTIASKVTTTVTKVLTTTRPANYTYDVGRTQATGEFTLMFADFDEYTAKLKTFTDKQAIYANGNEFTAKDPAVQEKNFSVLLEEKYFLVPCIARPYQYGSLMFFSSGITWFLAANDTFENSRLEFTICHGKAPTFPQQSKPKQYSFTNKRGIEIVRYGKEAPSYVWKEDTTTICVSVFVGNGKADHYIEEYEQFLKTLTFEKVEIPT